MNIVLALTQIVLPIVWYTVPEAAVLPWWVIFMPTLIAACAWARAGAVFVFVTSRM